MSEWNATLYDEKHDFVVEYGKGLLEFVPKNKKQSILDLGCGTGAVFHWVHDYNALLNNVQKVLKSNGLLVCEFGAHRNIATIENAFMEFC